MTDPISYEFPEELLKSAAGISLADLLDCPATQCWLISALGNSTRFASSFVHDMSPKQSHLVMMLREILLKVPSAERIALYKTAGSFVFEGKNERRHDTSA